MLDDIPKWLTSGAWLETAKSLAAAILILGAAMLAARLLRYWLDKVRRRAGEAGPLVYMVEQVGGYLLVLIGFLVALSTLGLDLQSFGIFAGALGVGVGLGLQGIVKEFFSGLVLIFDHSVRVGDFVEMESGVRGEIVEIGRRATRLRTNDDLSIVIPNSLMVSSRVTNWTWRTTMRRMHVPFSVVETADKATVREVVLAAAHALPFTQPDSAERKTQVWLVGFAGDGLDFELIVWPTLESARHPASMHAAYTWAIHDALTAAGIDNAAPQLDLRVKRLFGQDDEAALRLLRRIDEPRTMTKPAAKTTNDAAAAVFDDARRDAKARIAEKAAAGSGSLKG